MIRHTNSFILSIIIHILLAVSLFYAYKSIDFTTPVVEKKIKIELCCIADAKETVIQKPTLKPVVQKPPKKIKPIQKKAKQKTKPKLTKKPLVKKKIPIKKKVIPKEKVQKIISQEKIVKKEVQVVNKEPKVIIT